MCAAWQTFSRQVRGRLHRPILRRIPDNNFLSQHLRARRPRVLQDGYATAFPFLSTLYTIAHVSIWRTFAQPRWLAFLSALPASWFFASAGFWEVIA